MYDPQPGDIAINSKDWPGHVMMVYAVRPRVQIIHAQKKGGFHIDPLAKEEKNGMISYLIDNPTWVYRGPWGGLGNDADAMRTEVTTIAAGIARSATYGVYRAVRLFLGSKTFGGSALSRLQKYVARRAEFLAGNAGKFVTTVTCSEAVILSYQIAFFARRHEAAFRPFFIHSDAAHTMPRDLKAYLDDANNGWTTVQEGR